MTRFIIMPTHPNAAPLRTLLPPGAAPVQKGRALGKFSEVTVDDKASLEALRSKLGESGYTLVPDNPVSVPPIINRVELPENPAHFKAANNATCRVVDPRGFDADVLGATALHKEGITGRGVHVFVVDTGIGSSCLFNSQVGEGASFVGGSDRSDVHGHGTGTASKVNEVAPGATLHSVRVLGNDGVGSTSSILAGLDWIGQWVEKHPNDTPVVVNMSLAGKAMDVSTDPCVQKITELQSKYPIVFVISAGNDGAQGDNTVGSPGITPTAITVAASNSNGTLAVGDDRIASFSSRGGTLAGAGQVGKPNITAPGENVVILQPNDSYAIGSGTSFSGPLAAGGVGLLVQLARNLKQQGRIGVSPEALVLNGQFENTLMATATALGGVPAQDQGSGVVNLTAAAARFKTGDFAAPRATPDPSAEPKKKKPFGFSLRPEADGVPLFKK